MNTMKSYLCILGILTLTLNVHGQSINELIQKGMRCLEYHDLALSDLMGPKILSSMSKVQCALGCGVYEGRDEIRKLFPIGSEIAANALGLSRKEAEQTKSGIKRCLDKAMSDTDSSKETQCTVGAELFSCGMSSVPSQVIMKGMSMLPQLMNAVKGFGK